uniref:Nudix hydrolase domain-containing protein n=1 Tax=Trichobilharzia regenti TaxID=157069 RepID=A0AA85JB42_TRIRE|nr:unnamed protein product [Trichobilharzia regenti]
MLFLNTAGIWRDGLGLEDEAAVDIRQNSGDLIVENTSRGLSGTNLRFRDTAFRELTEELGLHTDFRNECRIEPLCAWEAAYPSRSDTIAGKSAIIPKSHHMVIYYSVKWSTSKSNSTFKDNRLCLPHFGLEADEVSAVVWLPRSVLTKLSEDWIAFEKYFQNQPITSFSEHSYPELSTMPTTIEIDKDQTPIWYWSIYSTEWQSIPANQLICGLTSSRNPSISSEHILKSESHCQPSGVTLGTLYAINCWLSSTSST